MSPTFTTGLLATILAIAPLVSGHCSENVQPAGSPTMCGVESRARSGAHFLAGASTGVPVHSVGDCAWFCFTTAGCGGFYFAPQGTGVTICQTFSGTTGDVVSVEPGSPFKIYDAACYTCAIPPVETPTPVETTPVETTPVETTPAETTPAETTPVETTPAETTPVETTPVETTQEATPTPISTSSVPFPAGNTTTPAGSGTGTGSPSTTSFTSSSTITPPFPAGNSTTPAGTGTGTGSPSTTTATSSSTISSSSSTILSSTSIISHSASSSPTPTEFSTSTIYATQTYTITSCAPTVTACPYGHVTTVTIAVSTTICPITATSTRVPHIHPTPAVSIPAGYTISTVYATNTYTNALGQVTTITKSLYETICPITAASTAVAKPTTIIIAGGGGFTSIPVVNTKPVYPTGSATKSIGGVAPSGTGVGSSGGAVKYPTLVPVVAPTGKPLGVTGSASSFSLKSGVAILIAGLVGVFVL